MSTVWKPETLRGYAVNWAEQISQIFILNLEEINDSNFTNAQKATATAYAECHTGPRVESIERSASLILKWISEGDVVRPNNLYHCFILLSQTAGFLINNNPRNLDIEQVALLRTKRALAAFKHVEGRLTVEDVQQMANVAKNVLLNKR